MKVLRDLLINQSDQLIIYFDIFIKFWKSDLSSTRNKNEMMNLELQDIQIHNELLKFGLNFPVTATTRGVLVKRLKSLIKMQETQKWRKTERTEKMNASEESNKKARMVSATTTTRDDVKTPPKSTRTSILGNCRFYACLIVLAIFMYFYLD